MRYFIIFSSLLFVLGCSKSTDTPAAPAPAAPTSNTSPTVATAAITCTAALPNNGAAVTSGQIVPISVSASGGTGPYTLNGQSFTSTLSVSKTYTNTSSANTVTTESFSVSDSTGTAATCGVSVTVLPAGGGLGSGLSCALALSPTVLRTNAPFQITGTVSGGTAPYVFQSFTLSGATLTSTAQTSATTIQATGSYPSNGLRTASLVVKDAALNLYSCYLSFSVLSPPTIALSANPSATVETGTSVSVSVSTVGFTATPTVAFSANDAAVTVTPLGGGVVVSASDKLVHNFILTAVATSGTDTATTTLPMQFSAYIPLSCTVTVMGTANTGSDITYTYQATNGESLQLTQFTPGTDGGVSSYGTNSVVVKYYSPGSKTATLSAQSTVSGKICQDGALLTNTFSIANALSCSVSFSNPSVYRGTLTSVFANVPSDAPFSPFYLTQMFVTPLTSWGYYGSNGNTGAYAAFFTPGNYNVAMTVQDLYGNTATCNGTQGVY